MKVLLIGGGGREHALAWKLAQSPGVHELLASPGNPGIAGVARCVGGPSDPEGIASLAQQQGVDLVVIGPEAPLVAGAVDALRARGIVVFGPDAAAARIEGSKAWAKQILGEAGVPAGRARAFTDANEAAAYLDELEAPFVVKADGLAAGKGVSISEDKAGAVAAIRDSLVGRRFGESGETVLIEEFLHGEELSIFVLSDGKTALPLAAAQDFKRALDDDLGPNTGGMGSYSPIPHLPADIVDRAMDQIFEPVLGTMAAQGAPFVGCLFGGLILTADGLRVIEFNCRFGDPEAQVLMPRLDGDLAELMLACAEGTLAGARANWRPEACISVVLASGGYPGDYQTGQPIAGLDAAAALEDVVVFHAGTAEGPVSAGGRVLSVSALGADLAQARARAYDAVELIDFEGKQYRHDIAARAAELEGSR
ncbi:MAG TPA: phosphoribosylamine--glycine ligase [Actinomycetota bacterium]